MGPGDKAHATKVRNVLRRKFGGEAKAIVRRECVAYLKAAGAKRPLVLWGGGLDAELCRAEGMEPIAVDDGSAADLLGISRASFRKAFVLSCETVGLEWRWGPAEEFAAEADSAILDFCSHWSRGVSVAAHACRHMVAMTATVMPSRVAVGSLSEREWKVIYRALMLDASALTPTKTRLYARNEGGDRAMVVMLRQQRNGIRTPQDSGRARGLRLAREKLMPEVRERRLAYKRDWAVANRASQSEAQRAYREAHRDELREYRRQWRRDHPEKVAAYQRAYLAKLREKMAG